MSSAPMFAGTQLLLGVFTGPHAFLRSLRRMVMSAGSRVPALRRALAANLVDDGPRPASIARHLRVALNVLRPRIGSGRPHT